MAFEGGLIKYLIFTPITLVGAASMYVYGGGILTLLNTLPHLLSGDFVEAFIEYFFMSALPPTSIGHIVFQIILGTAAAGAKWYIAMNLR
ncbi:MAG: hypothetical protein QCI38_09025 [Candidatus Thermoplasmatota archaeon]|nr:hypothetical protein [Candidatus Thermoplasmatota archaeon]